VTRLCGKLMGPYDTHTVRDNMANMAECLKVHALTSVLDLHLFPAKYYVYLRNVLTILCFILKTALNHRFAVRITGNTWKEVSSMPCSYQDNGLIGYSFLETGFSFNKGLW
jgi:hypothetical protein